MPKQSSNRLPVGSPPRMKLEEMFYDLRLTPQVNVVVEHDRVVEGKVQRWTSYLPLTIEVAEDLLLRLKGAIPGLRTATKEREEILDGQRTMLARRKEESAQRQAKAEARARSKAGAKAARQAARAAEAPLFVVDPVPVEEVIAQERPPEPEGRVVEPPKDKGIDFAAMAAKVAIEAIGKQFAPKVLRQWRKAEEAGKARKSVLAALDGRLEELKPTSKPNTLAEDVAALQGKHHTDERLGLVL